MSNKDGQIQTLRAQVQHLSEAGSKEDWVKSARTLAEQEVNAVRIQVTSVAQMELNDWESRAKLQADQLKDQLSQERTAAVILKSKAGGSRGTGLYRTGGGARRT